MKVRVTLVIDVDLDAHAQTYGAYPTDSENRQDVKEYVLNHIQSSAAVDEGVFREVRMV